MWHSKVDTYYDVYFVQFSYAWSQLNNHLRIMYSINAHHALEALTVCTYVCHIVIIYCTHFSITLMDYVMLLVMVDWRMSRYIFRMEWMLMGKIW